MVSALHRKLLRDLWILRGQVVPIALVVGCGIAAYIAMGSAYEALRNSRDGYFEEARMGDVFAHAARAPEPVLSRIASLPGVSLAYARVLEWVTLPVEFMDEPVSAELVSLPDGDEEPALGTLFLTEGRMPDGTRDDEVVVLEAFAVANHLRPGDTLPAILDGSRRTLRIVGLGMSPEYVFALPPGGLTIDPHFTVLWMRRRALAAAFRFEGAFNDVVVRMQPGATLADVVDGIDRELAPYGGHGAIAREQQASTNVLNGGLERMASLAGFVPFIFLSVAAFLLNVVLARLVHLQRGQVAALKALGYSDLDVGTHYLELVLAIVVLGSVLGIASGAWLGSAMTGLYAQYFRFPSFVYSVDPALAARAVLISLVAGTFGALSTVREVVRLPPAEAMRPPSPPSYAPSFLTGTPIVRLFETSGRMVLREIERRPMRTLLSALGIAMAIAIFISGRASRDAFNVLLDQQFRSAMREDLAVSFTHAVPDSAIHEVHALPGVLAAEGVRIVPVRFRHEARSRSAVIQGWPEHIEMRQLLDVHGRTYPVPEEGLVLSRKLAEVLDVEIGESLEVDILEGQRGSISMPVVGLVDDMLGLWGHMRLDALGRALREPNRVSMVLLDVDPAFNAELRERLRDYPAVLSVVRRESVIAGFEEQNGKSLIFTTLLLTFFAAIIAFGVVYNNARVALSMRSRDLASLRVLGFTRAEISAVLLGELAVQQILAIPLGVLLGRWLAHLVSTMADPERFRLPETVAPMTYAMAVGTVVIAGLVSALMVRRQLDKLDLIAVLKTRE